MQILRLTTPELKYVRGPFSLRMTVMRQALGDGFEVGGEVAQEWRFVG